MRVLWWSLKSQVRRLKLSGSYLTATCHLIELQWCGASQKPFLSSVTKGLLCKTKGPSNFLVGHLGKESAATTIWHKSWQRTCRLAFLRKKFTSASESEKNFVLRCFQLSARKQTWAENVDKFLNKEQLSCTMGRVSFRQSHIWVGNNQTWSTTSFVLQLSVLTKMFFIFPLKRST